MQKKDLPPDNKFCYYPWRGAHIMPDGNVVACCHQTYGHYGVEDFPIKQNLADKSLEKIINDFKENKVVNLPDSPMTEITFLSFFSGCPNKPKANFILFKPFYVIIHECKCCVKFVIYVSDELFR